MNIELEPIDFNLNNISETDINWTLPPITFRIEIPVPCGKHKETRGYDKDGNWYYRVEKVSGTSNCFGSWCLMNTGEWTLYPKYRAVVAKMFELGWLDGSGIAFGKYWDQAISVSEDFTIDDINYNKFYEASVKMLASS